MTTGSPTPSTSLQREYTITTLLPTSDGAVPAGTVTFDIPVQALTVALTRRGPGMRRRVVYVVVKR